MAEAPNFPQLRQNRFELTNCKSLIELYFWKVFENQTYVYNLH